MESSKDSDSELVRMMAERGIRSLIEELEELRAKLAEYQERYGPWTSPATPKERYQLLARYRPYLFTGWVWAGMLGSWCRVVFSSVTGVMIRLVGRAGSMTGPRGFWVLIGCSWMLRRLLRGRISLRR